MQVYLFVGMKKISVKILLLFDFPPVHCTEWLYAADDG